MPASSLAATAVVTIILFVASTLAGDFTHSCANYYLGNGISDATGELFIEAWCHGGQNNDGSVRPDLCSRLKLTECFQNVDGKIQPLAENEPAGGLGVMCDIESCAVRQNSPNGPVMSCYCENAQGEWKLASVDLNQHIGNEGGYLQCGGKKGKLDCLYPPQEGEL